MFLLIILQISGRPLYMLPGDRPCFLGTHLLGFEPLEAFLVPMVLVTAKKPPDGRAHNHLRVIMVQVASVVKADSRHSFRRQAMLLLQVLNRALGMYKLD